MHTAHVVVEITILNIEWTEKNMKPFPQRVEDAMFRNSFEGYLNQFRVNVIISNLMNTI